MSKDDRKWTEPAKVAPEAPTVPQSEIAKAIKEGIADGLTMGMGMVAKVNADNRPVVQVRGASPVYGPECSKCKQLVSACGGEHEMMVVYPSDPYMGDAFPGIVVNGRLYRSNHPGHAICVFKGNDFAYRLSLFEQEERNLRNGRKRAINPGAERFLSA